MFHENHLECGARKFATTLRLVLTLSLLCSLGCLSSSVPAPEKARTNDASIGPTMDGASVESRATPDAEPVVLNVAAASSLKFALDVVAAKFQETHPRIQVALTYGASGNLYAQAVQKSPFDVFLSADVDYPRKLVEQGDASEDRMFVYATGRLVVWCRHDSPLDPNAVGLNVLKDPSIQKVAIANPKLAPYGAAAMAVLENAGLMETVRDKLVLGDTIAQTAQFAESGGADLGLIALSFATSPAMRDRGKSLLIPSELHPPIRHGGVVLATSPHRTAAAEFRDFLMSAKARMILADYGFETPNP